MTDRVTNCDRMWGRGDEEAPPTRRRYTNVWEKQEGGGRKQGVKRDDKEITGRNKLEKPGEFT